MKVKIDPLSPRSLIPLTNTHTKPMTPALTIPALADLTRDYADRALHPEKRLPSESRESLYGSLSMLWIITHRVIDPPAAPLGWDDEKIISGVLDRLIAAINAVS